MEFFDAITHLYRRSCPCVCPLVHPSVHLSVCPPIGPLVPRHLQTGKMAENRAQMHPIYTGGEGGIAKKHLVSEHFPPCYLTAALNSSFSSYPGFVSECSGSRHRVVGPLDKTNQKGKLDLLSYSQPSPLQHYSRK